MAKDKVTVEITRRTSLNNKIFGHGGQYEVDQPTAQYLVDNERARVVKGKVAKKEPSIDDIKSNDTFLTFVKRNARAIIGILEAEAGGSLTTGNEEETDTTSESSADEEAGSEDEDEESKTPATNGSGSSGTEDETIPEDFPGHEILNKAGITNFSQIPRTKDELMKIEQMTGRVANQIGVKLNNE